MDAGVTSTVNPVRIACPFLPGETALLHPGPNPGARHTIDSHRLGRKLLVSPAAWRLIEEVYSQDGSQETWRSFASELREGKRRQQQGVGLFTLAQLFPKDFEGVREFLVPAADEAGIDQLGRPSWDARTPNEIARDDKTIAEWVARNHDRPAQIDGRLVIGKGDRRRRWVGLGDEHGVAFGGGWVDGDPPIDGNDLSDESEPLRKAPIPSVTPEALRAMSKNSEREVRRLVAANPSTPTDALSALSSDLSRAVREAVAANPQTPPEVLDRLAKRRDHQILVTVARNPSTWRQTLERLAKSTRREVADEARQGLVRSSTVHQASVRFGPGGPGRSAPGDDTQVVDATDVVEFGGQRLRLYIRPVTAGEVRNAVARNHANLAASLSLLMDAIDRLLIQHNLLDADVLNALRDVRSRAEEFRAAVAVALDGKATSAAGVGKAANTLVQLALSCAVGFVGGMGSGVGDGVFKLVAMASADAAQKVCLEVTPEVLDAFARRSSSEGRQ